MEKSLEKHMANTMKNQGVSGMVCADRNGLCLGTHGNGNPRSSGSIVAIAKDAAKLLSSNRGDTPVVCIETSSMNILIKENEGYTTAVYKQTSN